MRNLHGQKSHFQVCNFEIRPEKRCSIRHCFYTILDSFPIFCKNFLKVSDIMDVCTKIKKQIHYWWCYTVYNFIDFSHEDLQIFWWIVGPLFSLNISWNSLLVSFLFVSLRPLSCTLLIKLFDCLEKYIQTSGE